MFQEDRKFFYFLSYEIIDIIILSADTEIWQMNLGSSRITEPSLPDAQYKYGIALFLVEQDFCSD